MSWVKNFDGFSLYLQLYRLLQYIRHISSLNYILWVLEIQSIHPWLDSVVWFITTLYIWSGTFLLRMRRMLMLGLCVSWRGLRKYRRKANHRFLFFYLDKQIGDLLFSSDSWIFLRSHKEKQMEKDMQIRKLKNLQLQVNMNQDQH